MLINIESKKDNPEHSHDSGLSKKYKGEDYVRKGSTYYNKKI